jgi:hypothetical protein
LNLTSAIQPQKNSKTAKREALGEEECVTLKVKFVCL